MKLFKFSKIPFNFGIQDATKKLFSHMVALIVDTVCNPAIGDASQHNLCPCQAWINGEASQKAQPNVSLKRDFFLPLLMLLLLHLS